MFKIGLVLLCLAAGAFSLPNKRQELNCEDEELLPHHDCTKYYQCANGELIVVSCPPPLYFSPETKLCEYAEAVPECREGTRPPTDGTPLPPTTTESVVTTEALTTQPPTTEPPTTQPPTTEPPTTEPPTTEPPTTEPPTTEPPTTEPPTTEPPTTEPPTTEPPTTEPPTTTTAAPQPETTTQHQVCSEDGIYLETDPDDCSNYYLCAHGSVTPRTCPAHLLFDPKVCACNIEDLVEGCAPPLCSKGETAFKPVPSDCTAYIFCVDGEVFLIHCPGDLLFDPVLLECNLPESVTCLNNTSVHTRPVSFSLLERPSQTCVPRDGRIRFFK